MNNTPTPHNAAKYGEIAPSVLFCGDPMRVQYIAETYLDNPVCYTNVRGILGYTGTYQGRRVSVQAHGMGIPSISIYAHELYQFYGVENIIRIGSAGAIHPSAKLGSVVLAMGACACSSFEKQYGLSGSFAPIASFHLLQKAVPLLEKRGIPVHVGNVLSSDVFYEEDGTSLNWAKMNVLAVEMEAAGLYMCAARAQKSALCMLTITDELYSNQSIADLQNQALYNAAIESALSLAAELDSH